MRDRRGTTLGTCLAKAKGSGRDDAGRLLRSLKKTTQKGSPCPADVPSWVSKPEADMDGSSRDEALSLQMKSDLSEADLLLHSRSEVLPYLWEEVPHQWEEVLPSVGGSPASAASPGKAVGLVPAPVEERLAGVACGTGDTPGRDWLGRGPRLRTATEDRAPEESAGCEHAEAIRNSGTRESLGENHRVLSLRG